MVCPRCSSLYVKKDGVKKYKKGNAQQYRCKSCKRYFSVPLESEIKEYKEVSPGSVFRYESDKVVRVHGLTDVHVGANEFDLEKFQQAVKAIYEDDNAVWFGNGDLLELIPPNYKISQRGQEIPPDEQYLTFIDLVRTIKDKCLFIRGGNHDFLRSFNILDLDICKIIANEMNVPYFRMPGYSQIVVRGKAWNLVSAHGKSGAKNGDLELDKLAAVYSQGDVFFLGHNHQLYAKPIDSLRIEGGEESLHRRWYVRGGSFLRYAEYARYSMYPIVRTGWITMEFSEDGIKCWEN
jgi:predicted phosphodiesterase